MMDQDTGVKAPVTRLRRRLSVEQPEESKSPAPNTPTKRRPGRRPAKPELELIEENATTKTTPDNKKKTVTKELVAEEKPITPSRRSARIKSNTSIVSETAIVLDSPRAKRASRRSSHLGSDNEAPITPIKQTRRTRKDSTSSIDTADNQAAVKQSHVIHEPITEEVESNNRQSITSDVNNEKDESKNIRKSSRIQDKKVRKSLSSSSNELETNQSTNGVVEDMNNSNSNKLELLIKEEKNKRLSKDSTDLLDGINSNPNKIIGTLNKSTSALENSNSKSKRSRTKSCTVNTIWTAHEVFYSDNESSKKQVTNNVRSPLKLLNRSDTGDCIVNKSENKDHSFAKDKPDIINNEISCEYRQTVSNEKIPRQKSTSPNETNINVNIDNVQNIFGINPTLPYPNMKVTIMVDDCDTDSGKLNMGEDDQCVPEVARIMETSYKLETFDNDAKENESKGNNGKEALNDTCEPMDVDETLSESLLIDGNAENNTSMENSRKSKRSSILKSLDDSGSQSKGTLVLSHLKDVTTEINKSSRSPLKINDKSLSNSSTVLNITQENIIYNKNISLSYSTSTPLQQKSNEWGINASTSNTKNDSKQHKRNSKEPTFSELDNIEKMSHKSKEEDSSSNNSDDSENDSDSQENSNLMDDEAEDAGDDYESGDSQDEEDRKDAVENEIREKGETLSTEEDISNDSDYEKDSFIVSSAEEDNELLEGTEDDLSMSDNELSMSKKSKKKYNERKLKEQKKASREMFESRHQLNNSNNSMVSNTDKKTKRIRQRLSSSEPEHEVKKSSKAKNKQRLDSSQDESILNEENIKSPRRSKTPSQSICDDSVTMHNEREITISNHVSNNSDPLPVHITREPKTQNEMSVALINADNDSKEGENLDPLATTIVDDDSSMSSDNERIVQDYDSVLQGLNKTKMNKIKTGDISLNLENKLKKKEKNTIVDQLNLTQVKSKTHKRKTEQNNKTVTNTTAKPSDDNDESSLSSSSESAMLRLLFSEDSNNCEDSNNKNLDDSDDYISLKRTDGNTDIHNKSGNNDLLTNQSNKTASENKKKQQQLDASIREELSTNDSTMNQSASKTPTSGKKKKQKKPSESEPAGEISTNDSTMNQSASKTPTSGKKNKQKKPSESEPAGEISTNDSTMNQSASKTPTSEKKKKQKKPSESESAADLGSEDFLQFFIDTEGTMAQNITTSNKSLNRSKTSVSDKAIVDSDSDAPMEVSFQKEKNLTRSRIEDLHDIEDLPHEKSLNQSTNSLGSGKKKKKNSLALQTVEAEDIPDLSFIKSITNTPGSSKKKQRHSNIVPSDEIDAIDVSLNKSTLKTPQSGKKNKNKSLVDVEPSEDISNVSFNKSNIKTPKSGKKNKELYEEPNVEEINAIDVSVDKSILKTPQSGKKNKNKLLVDVEPSEDINAIDVSVDKSTLKTPRSGKKNKNKSLVDVEPNEESNVITEFNTSQNKTSSSKKKQKKLSGTSQHETSIVDDKPVQPTPVSAKKALSNTNKIQDQGEVSTEHKNKKRKRKISANVLEEEIDSNKTEVLNTPIKNKKKKVTLTENEDIVTEISKKSKNKKRKDREDDHVERATKEFKENSLRKVQVSRLPTTLLEQLDEKPKQANVANSRQTSGAERRPKKTKLTATTDFVVEEAKIRRNKPSMYLEESIYLNEDEIESKKQRAKIVKPKVLPFVPTASTSVNGYTSNFKVNVMPKDTKFVAQSSNIDNFKTDYLYNKKIKRNGTYDMYKKIRNIKLTKF